MLSGAISRGLQRGERLLHDLHGLLPGELSLFLHRRRQSFALEVFHDDVGGVVFVEAVENLHDARDRAEPGKAAGFVQEAVHALLIFFGVVGAVDFDGVAAERSGREVGGQILLDGDLLLQQGVPRRVGHAEAAVSHTVRIGRVYSFSA